MDLWRLSCEHVSTQLYSHIEQTPDQVQGQSSDGQQRKHCVLGLPYSSKGASRPYLAFWFRGPSSPFLKIIPSLTSEVQQPSFNWGLDRSSLTTAGRNSLIALSGKFERRALCRWRDRWWPRCLHSGKNMMKPLFPICSPAPVVRWQPLHKVVFHFGVHHWFQDVTRSFVGAMCWSTVSILSFLTFAVSASRVFIVFLWFSVLICLGQSVKSESTHLKPSNFFLSFQSGTRRPWFRSAACLFGRPRTCFFSNSIDLNKVWGFD